MSDVEKLWDKLSPQFGNKKSWNELSPEAQNEFIFTLNMMLQILVKA